MRNSVVIALLACAVAAHAASYTAYIGDANQYQVSAIATDANRNTYITGSRIIEPSSVSPYSPALTDVFVSKLDPSGNLTLIGTFSGKGTDQANGIAVDPSGNIYIAGNTTSPDFPLHNPLQRVGSAGDTGFLMKLAPDGSLIYSTYLGGALGPSSMNSVAADAKGNAYVTGSTQAPDYPHTPGMPDGQVSPSNALGGISGAFFAKIDPAGDKMPYAGALTGPVPGCDDEPGSDCSFQPVYTVGTAVAVDPQGNAYIAGSAGGGLPTTSGVVLAAGIGAFVAKVNSAGTGN